MLRRLTPLRIALLLGITLSLLRLGGCRPLDLLDLRALDYRLLQRGSQAPSPDVVVVAVDDASITSIGRWPWPRPLVASLIDRIVAGDPAVLGVDIVQSEATAACGLDGLAENIDDACRDALQRATGGADARLVGAVRASQRTILGYFFDFSRVDESPYVGEAVYPIVQRQAGGLEGEKLLRRATATTQNLPALVEAATGLGYFNFVPDSDGIYRHATLALRFGDRLAMPLSLAMLQKYWPDRRAAIRLDAAGVESVRLGDLSLPVDEHGQLLLNYRGSGRTFLHVPAADLLEGRIPPDVLRDKLVLLGVTAVGVGDVRATPLDATYPGVEIHATVLDNVLRADFLYRPAWAGSARLGLADVMVILALALVVGLILQYLRGLTGALAVAALLGLFLVVSQWLFVQTGALLSTAYPTLAIAILYGAISVQHYIVVEREKRQTRRVLELYLSPALATYVSDHPEMLKLGGEKSDRTVLFSDIRDFTPIAEKMSPDQLVELLNLYLSAMTDIVFDEDGMLDKYIGDAVMAVWGAPIPQADHAVRACRAAVTMIESLVDLNRRWTERGWPPIHIRVGLNSGPMVFGNMGSSGHLSLTVMGDHVNLGARLEGLNKRYGSTIMASEWTVAEAGDTITVRELDVVRVKGKEQSVRVFEILGDGGAAEKWRPLIEPFERGLAAYRERDWEAAITAFELAMQTRPDDGPSGVYLRRCREHLQTPPPPSWEAVTTFEG